MHGLGRVYMEPKGHIVLDRYRGEWEVMPSWIEEPEAAACKWVSIREDNARFDLPAVFSILVYTHPETGFPLAICDGSYHTLMRTGASAAVSAKWLARPDSSVLAILGTGSVGEGTLATCDTVFAWGEVRIWSRSQESVDRFLAEQGPRYPHLRLVGTTDVRSGGRGRRRDRHGHARPRLDRRRRVGEGRRAPRCARRRPRGRAGAASGPPAARAGLRGRHPSVRPRRRDQRPAARGPHHGGRRRRRDRQGDLRRARGPPDARSRSRSSTRPGSRSRTRPPCRSRSSVRSRPVSASRRR